MVSLRFVYESSYYDRAWFSDLKSIDLKYRHTSLKITQPILKLHYQKEFCEYTGESKSIIFGLYMCKMLNHQLVCAILQCILLINGDMLILVRLYFKSIDFTFLPFHFAGNGPKKVKKKGGIKTMPYTTYESIDPKLCPITDYLLLQLKCYWTIDWFLLDRCILQTIVSILIAADCSHKNI